MGLFAGAVLVVVTLLFVLMSLAVPTDEMSDDTSV